MNTTIVLRCEDEFKKLAEKQAKKQNRSLSNYIKNLIQEDIEKNK